MNVLKALKELPYGSLVKHNKKVYFKSRGLNGDIMTDTDGHWQFIDHTYCDHRIRNPRPEDYFRKKIEWKSFTLVHKNL